MKNETFGQEMLEILKNQHQCFLELKKMSKEQRELIKNQQSEELIRLLAKRQKLVGAIIEIQTRSAPYREKWASIKDSLAYEVRMQIGNLLIGLQEMLNVIIQQDQDDCKELSAVSQQTSEEMKDTTNRSRAANSYYSQASVGGNFQVSG